VKKTISHYTFIHQRRGGGGHPKKKEGNLPSPVPSRRKRGKRKERTAETISYIKKEKTGKKEKKGNVQREKL